MQDLEQYATSYSGLMRIERLQFIAEHCPQLRVEALKMALTFVQRTFNVDTYEEIHRKLTEASRYSYKLILWHKTTAFEILKVKNEGGSSLFAGSLSPGASAYAGAPP